MTEPDPPYTADEVAVLLRVRRSTVVTMTRDGRLPRIRGLGVIRIPRRPVLAYREWLDAIAAASPAMDILVDCPFTVRDHGPGTCDACGGVLTGLRRRWCSDECSKRWWVNHSWSFARRHAIEQAGGEAAPCERCGVTIGYAAEVNHIVPRNGQGYGRGCHHHQANLEVLCHRCHVQETNRQALARRMATR